MFENEPAGTSIGTVSATDADQAPFNKFSFELMSTHFTRGPVTSDAADPFTIDPDTGQIVTSHELDREKQAEYQLVVIATDVMKTELSSTTIVNVSVRDVNDNRPMFIFPSSEDSTIRLNTWQVIITCR